MIRTLRLERSLRIAVGLLAGLLLVGGAGGAAVARMNGLPDDAVLKLDGTVVTIDQLDARLVVLKALYGVQKPTGDKLDTFNRDAAKSMAVSRIIDSAADKRGIVISDKVAQDTLDKVIDDQMTDGRAGFVRYLSTSGISETDVTDEIKRQLATSRLVEEVTADVPAPTAAEIQKAYDTGKASMVTPEARHLRNIVVSSRTDAERVLRLAKGGASFGSLAATWSRDGSTKNTGGDLGTLTADQVEAGFARSAFAAPVHGFFGPVQTRYGWNVGQVVGVTASKPLTFEQVKAQIATELTNKARLDVWRDYLSGLLRSADIRYADDYRPAHPDAAPSDLPQ